MLESACLYQPAAEGCRTASMLQKAKGFVGEAGAGIAGQRSSYMNDIFLYSYDVFQP